MSAPRTQSLKLAFAHLLSECHAERLVRARCAQGPIKEHTYVLAMGKASIAMCKAAQECLGEHYRAGLCIGLDGTLQLPNTLYFQSTHPGLTQKSLQAGELALQFVSTIPANGHLLVLMSGGASVMCEYLAESVTLIQAQALNRYLISQNFAIEQMNQIRSAYSTIKNGRLARHVRTGVSVEQWSISDVQNDDPGVIGSGPFFKSAKQPIPLQVLNRFPWLSASNRSMLMIDAKKSPTVSHTLLSGNKAARKIIDAMLSGFDSIVGNEPIYGEVHHVAEQMVKKIRQGPSGFYIFGGECSLDLPAAPGLGGRNQHLALILAQAFVGEPIAILCGATDGVDGVVPVAGAVFDARDLTGLGISEALRTANSYTWWSENDGLLFTGLTGTNVADICVVWKYHD